MLTPQTATPLLAGLALAAGAAHAQDAGSGDISAAFPYERQFVEVNGHAMAYVEAGSGPTVLFVHGNPTSSYLWRNILPYVADGHRAIAVDLIGMGASDQPAIDYTFQDHYAYLEGFIEALDLQDLTLVLHDWGGGLGSYYATQHSDNVAAVALMEAAVPPALPVPEWADFGDEELRATFQAFRDPEQGPELVLQQNVFVEALLPSAIQRPLSEAEMAAYLAPFPTPQSRRPVLAWPNEIPIEGTPARNVAAMGEIAEWLASSSQPKLVLYADPGFFLSPEMAGVVAETYRNVETRFVGASLHFLQEDQPEMVGRHLSDWLRDRVAGQG